MTCWQHVDLLSCKFVFLLHSTVVCISVFVTLLSMHVPDHYCRNRMLTTFIQYICVRA